MTKFLFTIAFLLGGFVVFWIGLDFIGTDALALAVTIVIGGVYIIGFFEQLQFRRATMTLARALDQAKEEIADLEKWLAPLDESIRNSVRLRIEGDRVPLPSPVLTPYLVGLLVMLGLMGTFIGMVITLKGAVIALEGTTELQAIREGLTAPIGGLSLAFGTSVAGVAASAMLGLISALSRRERMQETSRLDTKLATVFRPFSLVHNRQETFKAMQFQAQALPEVATALQSMATKLELLSENLGDKLLSTQTEFHETVEANYTKLANSVEKSLNTALASSSQSLVENTLPVVKELLHEIHKDAQATQQQLLEATQNQMKTLKTVSEETSISVNKAWREGLDEQAKMQQASVAQITGQLTQFGDAFKHSSNELVDRFNAKLLQSVEQQTQQDEKKLSLWREAFEQLQSSTNSSLQESSERYKQELLGISEQQQQHFSHLLGDIKALTSALEENWNNTSTENQTRAETLLNALQETSDNLGQNTQGATQEIAERITGFLESAQTLTEQRSQQESQWAEQQQLWLSEVSKLIQQQLGSLREEESQRGEAAVKRIELLEEKAASHLTNLGQSLEEPMQRLIETASETPKAAAEVITQLRDQMSNSVERDNLRLEEQKELTAEINQLLDTAQQATEQQHKAIEGMITSSSEVLLQVSERFENLIQSETEKLNDASDDFAVSATEMASLGEAFAVAVTQFNDSNEKLIDRFAQIEQALEKSSSRSDEQLAYYVTQAREIIDHSMMSQKEIFEEMRHLSRQRDLFVPEETEA